MELVTLAEKESTVVLPSSVAEPMIVPGSLEPTANPIVSRDPSPLGANHGTVAAS